MKILLPLLLLASVVLADDKPFDETAFAVQWAQSQAQACAKYPDLRHVNCALTLEVQRVAAQMKARLYAEHDPNGPMKIVDTAAANLRAQWEADARASAAQAEADRARLAEQLNRIEEARKSRQLDNIESELQRLRGEAFLRDFFAPRP